MTDETYQLAALLGQCLLQRGIKVTAAESCTGGGVAHAITAIPGSSQWFDYGFVTYSNEAKQTILGVNVEVLQRHGAVSEEVVGAMAKGAIAVSGASLSVAISGIAGPGGGSPAKPVGTVWFAWCHSPVCQPQVCKSDRRVFAGDRESVRQQAVNVALQGLLDLVKTTV